MTVFVENKNDKKTLKFSKTALPAEYAIIEKRFAEPKTGTSQYGDWFIYGIKVHEIKSMNPRTGAFDVSNEVQECSFFPSSKLNEQFKDIPVGEKFKLFKDIVQGDKGEFTKFTIEKLTESAPNAEAKQLTLDDELAQAKALGVDISTAADELAAKYKVPAAFIKAKFNSL